MIGEEEYRLATGRNLHCAADQALAGQFLFPRALQRMSFQSNPHPVAAA